MRSFLPCGLRAKQASQFLPRRRRSGFQPAGLLRCAHHSFFSRYAVLITWFGDCFSSLRSADCNICHMVYSRFSIAFLQHQDGGIAQASLYFMRHAFWCARTQHWFDKPPEPSSPLGCGADFFNRCCVRVRCGFFTGARFGCSPLSRLFFLEEGSLTSSDGTRTA